LLGTLSAGNHAYVITAIDANGASSKSSGSFTMASSAAVAAVLSSRLNGTIESDWSVDSGNAATQSSDSDMSMCAAFATYQANVGNLGHIRLE
jgi:hypothetical protein